jgi:hypothetical protein
LFSVVEEFSVIFFVVLCDFDVIVDLYHFENVILSLERELNSWNLHSMFNKIMLLLFLSSPPPPFHDALCCIGPYTRQYWLCKRQ